MIPINQTIINHNPEEGVYGNCLQACIASLFELPLEEVPHFGSYPEDEYKLVFTDFIYEKGYMYEGWAPISEIENPEIKDGIDGFLIVSGISPRGFRHAVIYKDGKLFHDPHPSKLGLKEVLGFHIIKRTNYKFASNPWRLFF